MMKRKILKSKLISLFALSIFLSVFLSCTNSKKNNAENTDRIFSAQATADKENQNLESIDENVSQESSKPKYVFSWQKDSPESHGINAKVFDNLHNQYSKLPIFACVIAKDDYIIDEYYAEGYDSESLFEIHSCSKSITGTLAGIAIDRGLFSPDDKIQNYFEAEKPRDEFSLWNEITVAHLLKNTSGIDMSDSGNWYEWRASSNWLNYILDRKIIYKPGFFFNYSTGNTHLLSKIIENTTGQSLYDFAKETLFEKLGMGSAVLGKDPQGIGDGGNGYVMNIYDMLKFGRLYLNEGKWNDEQIIPEWWVKDSTKVQVSRNEGTANYGYQWWIRDLNYIPTYFAWGWAGQFIFVVPEKNLIVAFTSNNTGSIAVYLNTIRELVKY